MLQQAGGQAHRTGRSQTPILLDDRGSTERGERRAQKDDCPVDAENLPEQKEELLEHALGIEGVSENPGKIAQDAQRVGSPGSVRRLILRGLGSYFVGEGN